MTALSVLALTEKLTKMRLSAICRNFRTITDGLLRKRLLMESLTKFSRLSAGFCNTTSQKQSIITASWKIDRILAQMKRRQEQCRYLLKDRSTYENHRPCLAGGGGAWPHRMMPPFIYRLWYRCCPHWRRVRVGAWKLVENIKQYLLPETRIKYLFITHCHLTMWWAAAIKRHFGCTVVAHALDAPYLESGDEILLLPNVWCAFKSIANRP